MSGFIALDRSAFEHPLLRDADRFRAWFWLVAHAAWKPTRHDARGRTILLDRGQLCAGREYLAEKWGWSASAVERFLTRLETEQMIERESGQGKTVITICNYSKFQDVEEKTGQTSGQQTGQKPDRNRTTKEQGNKGTSYSDPYGSGGGAQRPAPPEPLRPPPDDPPLADPIKVMFDSGIRLFAAEGKPEQKARSLLAKWRKQHGTEAVLVALGRAQREGAIDLTSFMQGVFRHARASHNDDEPTDPLVRAAIEREAQRTARCPDDLFQPPGDWAEGSG